jgi:hypothetical protein
MKEVKLCHGKKCCPVLSFKKEGITISDDFNGSVVLTKEQTRILSKELIKLIESYNKV